MQFTTLNNKNRLANAASHDTDAYQEDDGETVSYTLSFDLYFLVSSEILHYIVFFCVQGSHG